jgi:hypothetical protein
MKVVIAIVITAAVLGALYVWMKPEPAASPAAVQGSAKPSAPQPAEEYGAAAARDFDVTVAQGRIAAGGGTLRVTQGASVVIRVTSDRADELHLHGYDLGLALRAGVPGALAFTADKAGRFELELHHAGLELGALEVQPK